MGEHEHDCQCRGPRWHESLFQNLFSFEGFMVVFWGGMVLATIVAAFRA